MAKKPMIKTQTKRIKQEKVLLTFLKRTKAGKYAKITGKVLCRERMDMLRQEPVFEEENYYYSTR